MFDDETPVGLRLGACRFCLVVHPEQRNALLVVLSNATVTTTTRLHFLLLVTCGGVVTQHGHAVRLRHGWELFLAGGGSVLRVQRAAAIRRRQVVGDRLGRPRVFAICVVAAHVGLVSVLQTVN